MMSEKKEIYLDHAGAGRYTEKQIDRVFEDLKSLKLANPHSRNPSSRITTDIVDQARFRILKHFYTTQDEYSVIFTSGATAALKLVAENFDFNASDTFIPETPRVMRAPYRNSLLTPCLAYLIDNHTSVIGMREIIDKKSANIYAFTSENVEQRLAKKSPSNFDRGDTYRNLFVFPGESNFSGRKYSLEWIDFVAKNALAPGKWFTCLDAACLVSTEPLDLGKFRPDFVTVSFYKIFGYPTGLGALLVKNSSAFVLDKRYFGGGTVLVNLASQDFHKKRENLVERFEDGTIDFLGIAALRHGFDAINDAGGIDSVSAKVFSLAKFTANGLKKMRHGTGAPIVEFYCDHSDFSDSKNQGGIVNFNLLKPDGNYVGFTEVEKMAELYNINLRTGCFCNQGACQEFLKLSDDQLKENFQQGKVCGDEVDLIDGKPVGSVRISFGLTSEKSDAVAFLGMVFDCFVVEPQFTWQELLKALEEPSISNAELNLIKTAKINEKIVSGIIHKLRDTNWDHAVSLANEAQYLLLHRPSIRYLHEIVSKHVPEISEDDLVMRFRGNIIVDGGKPFEEDSWTEIRIGEVDFKVVGKCSRCQMVCIDQNTGEKNPNILTSLRDIREGAMTFGVYLQAQPDKEKAVRLKIGDTVLFPEFGKCC